MRNLLHTPAKRKPTADVIQIHSKLSAQEQEFLPRAAEMVYTPPSIKKQRVLHTMCALFGCTILWASVAEMDIVATANGKVIPDGRTKSMQPMATGMIKAFYVKDGQYVKQNDLLVEFDPTEAKAQLKGATENLVLVQMEIERLRSELNDNIPNYAQIVGATPELTVMQESLRNSRMVNYRSQISEANSNLAAKDMTLESLRDGSRKLQMMTRVSTQKETIMRSLKGKFISIQAYNDLKLTDDQNRSDLAAQNNRIKSATKDREAAREKIEQLVEQHRAQILAELADKTSKRSSLQTEVDKAEQVLQQKTLRSPIDGQIQNTTLTTIGGVVNAGTTVATVVPLNTPLIIEASLPNTDIGFVKENDPVDIKVDTWSFQKYGTIKGKVVGVSPDAEDSKTGSMYKIRIKPDAPGLNINGKLQPIQTGMTVQADVKTDRRKIITFILNPITKYIEDGTRTR